MSTAFYLTIPQLEGNKLWQAAKRLGSPEEWGLKRNHLKAMNPFMLEPYTFSSELVKHCFSLVDKIAASTDVERLFPDGYSMPRFQESPPEDSLFKKEIRERFAVLG